jgi:HPr kinase/phosphorylase
MDGNAALLIGPSGSGKSDLALRLISSPLLYAGASRRFALVADDQVLLEPKDGCLMVRSPPTIAGRIEVRGIGILEVPFVAEAAARLVVDLTPGIPIERLPAPAETFTIGAHALPLLRLNAFEASAPAKVMLRLAQLASA